MSSFAVTLLRHNGMAQELIKMDKNGEKIPNMQWTITTDMSPVVGKHKLMVMTYHHITAKHMINAVDAQLNL